LLAGPRVIACGPHHLGHVTGGAIFGTMYRQADGPDEMRKAVREHYPRRAGFIKVDGRPARARCAT
jgi:hypothetical protein